MFDYTQKFNELIPIFIVGSPKSGTTLLQGMFDGHPELLTIPVETQFYRYYDYLLSYYEKRRWQFWRDHYKRRFLNYWLTGKKTYINRLGKKTIIGRESPRDFSRYDFSKIEARVKELSHKTFTRKELFSALLTGAWEAGGNNINDVTGFAEKTPKHILSLQDILEDFPGAFIIQVVRDPRDNYISLAKMKKKNTPGKIDPLKEIDVAILDEDLQPGIDIALNGPPASCIHYKLIKYDDLVVHPKEITQGLANWLGISDWPGFQVVSMGGIPWNGNSSTDKKFKGISKSRLEIWRSHDKKLVDRLQERYEQPILKLGFQLD